MPQVGVAFVNWLIGPSLLAKATGLALKVLGWATIGFGVHIIGRLVTKKPSLGNLNSTSPLQMSREPVQPRRVVYGRTRVSGAMVFAHVGGASNEYLHMIIALGGHEFEAIQDVYFNNEVLPLDGGGNATGDLAGYARVKKHLGADDQAADADLVGEAPTVWTADDRLQGIPYLYPRLKWDQNKYPGGIPNVSAVVKGAKVYDPRDSGTAWSDNPALCIRDYLTNTLYGLGVDADEIDEASFIAAANICDESVVLNDDSTEKRYTLNGSFDLAADPGTILEKLVATMAGTLVYVGGKWSIYAGAHRTPTITLDEDDLRGPIRVQTKASMRDTCNGVRGTFSSPDMLWQPDSVVPVPNSTYQAEDGIELWRDMDLPFTTSHATAQRLFKIELERSRQDVVCSMPCKLTALRVQAGSVVMVNNSRFGWEAKQFVVIGLKLSLIHI